MPEPRRKRNAIWTYFTVVKNEKVQCDICHAKISIRCGSTQNLGKHMRLKHVSVVKGLPPKKSLDRATVAATVSDPAPASQPCTSSSTATSSDQFNFLCKFAQQGDLKLSNSHEDEASIRKHIDHMKAEMRDKTPHLCLIEEKTPQTRTYRQQYCHSNTTADVLMDFTALRTNVFVTSVQQYFLFSIAFRTIHQNRLGWEKRM